MFWHSDLVSKYYKYNKKGNDHMFSLVLFLIFRAEFNLEWVIAIRQVCMVQKSRYQ